MLLTRGELARHRWFFRGSVLCLVAAFVVCVATRPPGEWWPSGGSNVGLVLGVAAALIIGFEMLLWPRKRWPAFPPFNSRSLRTVLWGRTQVWMRWHIWLGLLSLPLALMHSGTNFWNNWFTLPWVLALAMLVVYVSGIYGLWLQNWIPRRLLQVVAEEVPAAEIDRTLKLHRQEYSERLSMELVVLRGRELTAGQRVAAFYDTVAREFLDSGNSRSVVAADARAMTEFGKLRQELLGVLSDSTSRPFQLLTELEELCSLRRQLDLQRQLQSRLHSWLLIHLPVSVLLVFLLLAHILTAMKYV